MQIVDIDAARRVLELTLGEYSTIRGNYWAVIYDAVEQYLTGSNSITSYKNTMKRAAVEAITDAANLGYMDGNTDETPMEPSEEQMLTLAINTELAHIDELFARLSELRKAGEFDAINEAYARADGYAKTLDRVYNEFKTRAAGKIMLTFVGTDGKDSCSDCKKYKNKRHKASWWVSHNAVPPNRDFECGGWRCQHVLVNDKGELFTI